MQQSKNKDFKPHINTTDVLAWRKMYYNKKGEY